MVHQLGYEDLSLVKRALAITQVEIRFREDLKRYTLQDLYGVIDLVIFVNGIDVREINALYTSN